MDTDILVTGTLWHLLKLPSAIHFAASGLGFLGRHSSWVDVLMAYECI